MKRKPLLIFFIAIASSQILQAQISKGNIFIGGQAGFANHKNESSNLGANNRQTNFLIAPAFGIVTKDNLVWGFDIPLNFYKQKSLPSGVNIRTNLAAGAGVFVRKYFEVANRLYLFGQGRVGGNYISEKYNVESVRQKTSGYGVNLSFYPGVSFILKKNIHLESGFYNLASIGYTHTKTTSTDPAVLADGKASEFYATAIASGQSSFSVGIRFFLPGKSKS